MSAVNGYNPAFNTKLLNFENYSPYSNLLENVNNASVFDVVKTQNANNSSQTQGSSSLEQKFQETKDKQGFLGKLWDGFKNLTGLGHSSNDVENKIQQYKNGEISYEEAMSSIESFDSKQTSMVDTLANVATGLVTAGAAIMTGGVSLAAGAAIGAGVKAGIKTLDRATNEVEGDALDAKQIIKDGATGAVDGLVNVATAGMIKAPIAGQTVKEAAKQGVIQGAKAGAISGAAAGAASYTVEAVVEEDVDFTLGGLVSSTAQNAIGGAVMGGALGGVTGGLQQSKLNASIDTPETLALPEPKADDVKLLSDGNMDDVKLLSSGKTDEITPVVDDVNVSNATDIDTPKLVDTDVAEFKFDDFAQQNDTYRRILDKTDDLDNIISEDDLARMADEAQKMGASDEQLSKMLDDIEGYGDYVDSLKTKAATVKVADTADVKSVDATEVKAVDTQDVKAADAPEVKTAIDADNFASQEQNKIMLENELRKRYSELGYSGDELEIKIQNSLNSEDGIDLINSGFTYDTIAIGHGGACGYNHLLHKGTQLPDEAIMLDVAMDKLTPTTSDMTTYRGFHGGLKSYNQFIDGLKSKQVGDVYTDTGFAYSSFNENIGQHWSGNDGVLMEIKIPKGAKVSYAPGSEQSECLFMRNSQFKILEKNEENGLTKFVAEYILP